jgi:hypothetical protein
MGGCPESRGANLNGKGWKIPKGALPFQGAMGIAAI